MSNARENPFFSVILPIYNVEPFLEECIHSVLDQEFTDYELILVDDGSLDGCPEICDRYAAEYAHIRTVHKENGGLSSARNAGLEVAEGQYIWWVDSDDWVEPDSLQTLYKACEDGRADMVKLNFTRNGEKETIFKNLLPARVYTVEDRDFLLDKAFLQTGKFGMSACGYIYRRGFLEKYKLCFVSEREIGSEDFFFNLQALAGVEVFGLIEKPLYHYRLRAGSLTQRYRKNLFAQYTELYKRLLAYYAEIGMLENCESRIHFFYVWCLIHGTCFSHEYRAGKGHTLEDGRKNVRNILKNADFRLAAKRCTRKHFQQKQWLQLLAMRLGFEPLFYWLYVVKPQRKKGLHNETKNSTP